MLVGSATPGRDPSDQQQRAANHTTPNKSSTANGSHQLGGRACLTTVLALAIVLVVVSGGLICSRRTMMSDGHEWTQTTRVPPLIDAANAPQWSFDHCLHRLIRHLNETRLPGRRSEDLGFPAPVVLGHIIAVDHKGKKKKTGWLPRRGPPKNDNNVTRYVIGWKNTPHRGGPIAHSIAWHASSAMNRSTILFLSAHDVDYWTAVGGDQRTDVTGFVEPRQPNEADEAVYETIREEMHLLLDKCPIFLLSWNPCGAHPVTGRIGRRTIPILDSHPFPDLSQLRAPSPEERKKGVVVWRGVTTGFPADKYSKSDRFRMVEWFQATAMEGANVSFTVRVQRIEPTIAPATMFAGELSPMDMAAYRVQLDVDGNTNAWRGLRWKLAASTAVVKIRSSRRCVQWYYPLLQDGVHLRLAEVENAVEAVKALSNSTNVIDALSKKAQKFAEEHLTIAKAWQQLQKTIDNLWEEFNPDKNWNIQTP